MSEADSVARPAVTPFFMKRSDGMSDEYIAAATKLATMCFQTMSCLQTHVLDAPAYRGWADVENRRLTVEQAHYIDAATELAELVLPELGVEPEGLRLEAESSFEAGRKFRGRVALLTLNRPDMRNAQSIRMLDEIDAALDIAQQDAEVRVVVIAASGSSFSAGHDMKATRATGAVDEYEVPFVAKRAVTETLFEHEYDKYVGKCLRLRDFPKPTIALTQGHCIAAGWMVASMCDLVIASDDAKFSDPVVRMACVDVELPIEFWDVGVRKAKELLFTGDALSAADAHRLGFVNHVVARDELENFGLAMATRIAAMPPVAIRMTKLSMNRCLDQQGQANSFWQHYATHQLAHQTDEFKTLRSTMGTKDGVKLGLKEFLKERDKVAGNG